MSSKKRRDAASTNETIVDIEGWAELGRRLAIAGPRKFQQISESIEKIVEAQETIAQFDWQLLFGKRPSKRYQA